AYAMLFRLGGGLMNRKTTSHVSFGALVALNFMFIPQLMSAQTPDSLDSTFGTGGVVTTFFGGNGDDGKSVVLQTDGKIVVGGSTTKLDGTTDFALARYNGNGTLDATFGKGGKVTTTFNDFDFVGEIALQSDSKIVAAGLTVVKGLAKFAVARYNSNGTLDATFGSGGKVITGFGGSAQAFAAAV